MTCCAAGGDAGSGDTAGRASVGTACCIRGGELGALWCEAAVAGGEGICLLGPAWDDEPEASEIVGAARQKRHSEQLSKEAQRQTYEDTGDPFLADTILLESRVVASQGRWRYSGLC